MSMKMKTGASALVLFLALAAPTIAQDSKSIVDAENKKWIEAHNKGDAVALTALYTKDAVIIAAETPAPIVGTDNILKYFKDDLAHPSSNLALRQTETRSLSSDRLLDAGIWTLDVPNDKGGPPLRLTGPYVVTFVRQGSAWLLQTDASGMMPPKQ
jgi:ketosteroid isomerase-like protein